jgi:flagellar basal-body rod protein FlgF
VLLLKNLFMQASVIAFSRQRDLFKQLEIISNNIANAESNGFKADLAVYLKSDNLKNGNRNPTPNLISAVDLSDGTLTKTGRDLDVAIQGRGFFSVETPLGVRYTRNGGFAINAEGSLVDAAGNSVVGDSGTILMSAEDSSVEIGENGEIYGVNSEGRNLRGTLSVVKFEDESVLQKVGNGFFKTDSSGESATVLEDYKILQGGIESSNVNQVNQLTELIDISRTVASLARIVQDQNQMLRSAVKNILGTSG